MEHTNLLIIMADEHNSKFLGCAGHPKVRTPHLDKLASRGTRFTSAYTDSPICIPARASFATGQPVHKIQCWDNAHPYDGSQKSWGHRLQEAGHPVTSIGKLHYRDAQADVGFDEQINPMHVVNGTGDVLGSVRDPLPVRNKSKSLSEKLGAGETGYTSYDRDITTATSQWLINAAENPPEKPWVTFASFVCPHFPLVAPSQFLEMYDPDEIDLPKLSSVPARELHPWFSAWRNCFTHDDYFDDDKRRLAIAAYMGLCSFVDDNIGQVLSTLSATGLDRTTRVIYLSDHGDNLGARGMWGKSNFYEESASVPLIVAGPDVPEGAVCDTPTTISEIYSTVIDSMQLAPDEVSENGRSWFDMAKKPDDQDRTILSQYHAVAAISGAYMLRRGKYKYCYYVGMAPQLFDLESDPEEVNDLANETSYQPLLAEFESVLREILDPEEVDSIAKDSQANLVAQHGGREAVVTKGTFGPTPAPGETPVFAGADDTHKK